VETTDPIRLPSATAALIEHDLAEILAAVELVAHRVATRVTLTGLEDPEQVAGRALAFAQLNRVRFALRRDPEADTVLVIVGPREA
jgi:hypothetical protein